MLSPARKLLLVALPAAIVSVIAALVIVEVWVRLAWDDRQGTPGFYLSDPVLGQRLAPGYDGWFAGAPVHINALGFRDSRDYTVEKPTGTYRILVLGDSVTFGHGALYETTYPYLLEQRLKAWRPDVSWEVWNLGVPGYNTRQELDYLRAVRARFAPDLVVVGFFVNDFTGNEPVPAPSFRTRATSVLQRFMQRRLYSYEFYKRTYLTMRWKVLTDPAGGQRVEHLATEQALLAPAANTEVPGAQQLTDVEHFDDEQVARFVCTGVPGIDPRTVEEWRARVRDPSSDLAPWVDALRGLQAESRHGSFPIVVFVNLAPDICQGEDRFYDGGMLGFDDALLEVVNGYLPAVSSARAFLHYRPSQMPAASAHAFGNANRVKADALFTFLRDRLHAAAPRR